MDGKKGLLLAAVLVILTTLVSACDTKKKAINKTTVVDNSNSHYANKLCYGAAIANRYIVRWRNGETSILNGMDRQQVENQFLAAFDNQIESIEQDRKITLNFEAEINQTPEPTNVPLPIDYWGPERIEAKAVWDQNITGENIAIAVIDSGVDISHPQLKNQIYINTKEIPDNGIDDDNNGLVDDYYGFDFYTKTGVVVPVGIHGTHVSGIIAADKNAGEISGLAPKAKILPLNFMSHDEPGGSMGDAILAIDYAVKRGVKIINASWGGATCSETLKTTIDNLATKNILFVAAAGNDGFELDFHPEYPAVYKSKSQLTVGATMFSDRMAGFSNYSDKFVDLMAPGSMIWSTVPDNDYKALSGTSMAAPFVSGAAALLWSKFPEANVVQIKEALIKSVDIGDYPSVSKGRLNIKKAIQWMSIKQ